VRKLIHDRTAAPRATPRVPVAPARPDNEVEPVISSAISAATVAIPMYAVDPLALPVNRVQIRRFRVDCLAGREVIRGTVARESDDR
jgi:hypothetical protein